MTPSTLIAQEDLGVRVFAWLNQCVATLEGKVLYILALICVCLLYTSDAADD